MNGYKERRFGAEIDGRPGRIKKQAGFGCFVAHLLLLLDDVSWFVLVYDNWTANCTKFWRFAYNR